MSKPLKPVADKKAPKPKRKSSDDERPRVIRDYIDDLKNLFRKLRKRLR